MSAFGNIVDAIHGFQQRAQDAKVRSALSNYLTDPDASITAVNAINPVTAIGLQKQHLAEQATAASAANDAAEAAQKKFAIGASYLRGVPAEQLGGTIDQLAPTLKTQGYSDQEVANFKQAVTANPTLIHALDKDTWKADNDMQAAAPGTVITRGGVPVYRNPLAPHYVAQGSKDTGFSVTTLDPNNPDYDGVAPGHTAHGQPSQTQPVNNRGAIRWDGKSQWQGMTNVNPKPGDFVQFDTQANGDRAAMINITNQGRLHGINTLRGLITKYAPQEDGNDTPAYIATVSRSLGVNPDAKLDLSNPQLVAKLYHAGIVPVENTNGGTAPRAGSATVQTMAPAPKDRVRAATPQEIAAAGYEPGTAAQVDDNGKFVNLKTPPAGKAGTGRNDPTAIRARAQDTMDTMDRLEREATAIMNDPNLDHISGTIMGALPNVRQGSVDLQSRVDGLKNNIGLAALSSMKQLSATGASGLGQLSNREGERLDSMFGNLNQPRSSADSKRRVLAGIIKYAQDKKAGIQAGLGSIGQPAAAPAASTPNLVAGKTVYKGHLYLGGDPSQPSSWRK